MDRMLVRQRQAHNARDFRPKFIIAFLGESGNLCERRGGTATFAGWGGNDGTTTFATGATSKQPSEAPSVCCQISDKPCPPSHLRLRARRMPIVCLRARCPIRPAFRHPSAAAPQLVSAETCHLAWPRCRRTWPRSPPPALDHLLAGGRKRPCLSDVCACRSPADPE